VSLLRRRGRTRENALQEAQKAQTAAEVGLWTRVYEKYRCRAKHYKHGPHCFVDEQGNHHKLLSTHLEDTVSHIKGNMNKGEKEEDIDVNSIELPPHVNKSVFR
jgi:hypothetical protein